MKTLVENTAKTGNVSIRRLKNDEIQRHDLEKESSETSIRMQSDFNKHLLFLDDLQRVKKMKLHPDGKPRTNLGSVFIASAVGFVLFGRNYTLLWRNYFTNCLSDESLTWRLFYNSSHLEIWTICWSWTEILLVDRARIWKKWSLYYF